MRLLNPSFNLDKATGSAPNRDPRPVQTEAEKENHGMFGCGGTSKRGCESCCRKDSALESTKTVQSVWLTKTAHSVRNTQAKAMSRTWEKQEGSVEHIMQKASTPRVSTAWRKRPTLPGKRNSAEQMHTLHCRGHADWDIGPKAKAMLKKRH